MTSVDCTPYFSLYRPLGTFLTFCQYSHRHRLRNICSIRLSICHQRQEVWIIAFPVSPFFPQARQLQHQSLNGRLREQELPFALPSGLREECCWSYLYAFKEEIVVLTPPCCQAQFLVSGTTFFLPFSHTVHAFPTVLAKCWWILHWLPPGVFTPPPSWVLTTTHILVFF